MQEKRKTTYGPAFFIFCGLVFLASATVPFHLLGFPWSDLSLTGGAGLHLAILVIWAATAAVLWRAAFATWDASLYDGSPAQSIRYIKLCVGLIVTGFAGQVSYLFYPEDDAVPAILGSLAFLIGSWVCTSVLVKPTTRDVQYAA